MEQDKEKHFEEMENSGKKNSEVKEDEDEQEKESKEKQHERVIVKGYMRPDGTSYYVVIPKEIRQLFDLKGGEYFLIKAKPSEREIKLKIAEFVEEGQP